MGRPDRAPMSEAQRFRLAGVLFFIGGCCMLIAGFGTQTWMMLLGGALELVAWLCFVTRANQLEKKGRA